MMWRIGGNNKCKPLSAKFFGLRGRGGTSNLRFKQIPNNSNAIDIHEYVHVIKQHAFMKLKRN